MAIKAAVNKKGGVDDLGKLRNGAKRSGAILTFFFGWRCRGFLSRFLRAFSLREIAGL
jgi:hypothetical protein